MRTFRFFFKYLIITCLVFGLVAIVVPWVQLERATRLMKDELESLNPDLARTEHREQSCVNAPGSSPYSVPIAYQLRFVDDTNYQVELLCSYIEETPVLMRTGKLPFFVRKVAGSTGFYYSLSKREKSSVRLSAVWYLRSMLLDGITVETSRETVQNVNPKSVCSGYGYTCCEQGVYAGVGDVYSNVKDCPSTCYSACSPLPYVESFNADPYPEDGSTIVMRGTSQQVIFSYAASSRGPKIAYVTINYGDGSHDQSTEKSGIFTHQFECTSSCRIPVTLTATDVTGQVSVENPHATLYIVKE